MYIENLPLHAAIEMGGAIIALMVAYLLILLNSTNRGSSFNYAISAALIVMGLLDGLHAIMPSGNNFVWFRSAASFFGGLFFAAIWLPENTDKTLLKYLPLFAIIIAVLIAIFSLAYPVQVPLMITSGGFSNFFMFLNTSSGILFLLAATKLYLHQRITKINEDHFFLIQCILFGLASLIFITSQLWDRTWWAMHYLRLVAYILVLWLVVINVRGMIKEIHQLALYDSLTGLPNRSLLIDRLKIALTKSSRNHNFGAIIFIDVDNFKMINDSLGHASGDMLLQNVANRLKDSVRKADTVSRIGGDEFAIFVENLGEIEEDASINISNISKKILNNLAQEYSLATQNYFSTASIGVNLFYGIDKSIDQLINNADMAMYKAKSLGRNKICFFDTKLQKQVEDRAAIETDLHFAIINHELELYYQVQIDRDNKPIGAEALIRWIHPKRGSISPAYFIPIAEETSVINDLGNWVLDAACKQLLSWQRNKNTSDLILAVNISAVQFRELNFVETVKGQIKKYEINPSNLKFELTETVALEDLDVVEAKMLELKEIGICFSLDDFGTGYSSLSYLKQLPFNQIKIDQKFISGITTDNNDAVMVKTIIGLANNFNMSVIAEGVETERQLIQLKEYGCNLYQGYFFSKPIPVKEFENLLISIIPKIKFYK